MKVIQFHLDSQSLLKAMRNGKKKNRTKFLQCHHTKLKKDQVKETKMKSLVRFSIYFSIRPHFFVHYTGNLLTVVFVMYTNLSDSKASVSDVLFILCFHFAIFCVECEMEKCCLEYVCAFKTL